MTRGEELVRAMLGLDLVRYDVQVTMADLTAHHLEMVHVLREDSAEPLEVAPLETRSADLQLNMKAKDASGDNLVILTRAELRPALMEVFDLAAAELRRRPDVPAAVASFFEREDRHDAFFSGEWLRTLPPADGEEADVFFHRAAEEVPPEPTVAQASVILFLDVLYGSAYGFYRPWVLLPPRAGPEGKFPRHVFVKYVADEAGPLNALDRLTVFLLGWFRIEVDVPLGGAGSSHFRLRPPQGAVLAGPVRPPHGATDGLVEKRQAQFYWDEAAAARVRDERVVPTFRARVSQTVSMRILVALLFGVIAFVPLILGLVNQGWLWDGSLSARLSGSLADRGAWGTGVAAFRAAVAGLTTADVGATAALALPVALGLVSSTWERPGVRVFAISQLTLATALLVVWLLGSAFTCAPAGGGVACPDRLSWSAAAVAFWLSAGFLLYHLGELLASLLPARPLK